VDDELMAEEVDVDPVRAGAALSASEDAGVELAGLIEIVDRDGEMEEWYGGW
jgi:hypothetical protein